MSELKLKPCPFCGGTDIDIRTNDYGLSWYSFCNDCGVMCGYAMTKDDVMNAWNMRAGKIEEAPTVDAVQVVRCGQCRYFRTAKCTSGEEGWFCADGERKEQRDE